MDLLMSVLMLIVAMPLMLVIYVFLALTNGGRAVFWQERVGLGEIPFVLVKFRTLQSDGLTPVFGGSFLRRTSLDELPQLWNVLRGEMSLIGPRPLFEKYLPLYTEYHRHRHDVRPGITGWAQVNGRNTLSWSERFDHDVDYAERVNWRLDLLILIRTVVVLFQFRKADFHEQDLGPFEGYE